MSRCFYQSLRAAVLAGFACLVGACSTASYENALAERGVLEPGQRDWQRVILNLNGDYGFAWQQLLNPELTHAPPEQFLRMPGAWNDAPLGPNGTPIPADGYASYRLSLRGLDFPEAALRVPTMHTAYRLYANGVEISRNGTVGTSRESSRAQYQPKIVRLPAGSPDIELLIHISNFQHRKGGTWASIQLGQESVLREQRERSLLLDFFMFGSLLIMGIYHLGLFAMRRVDRSPLYFGLFCLLVALRILTTGEHYFGRLLPDLDWEIYIRLQYYAVYLALPAFAAFAYHGFRRDFPLWLYYAICGVSFFTVLFVLVTPARLFSWSMLFFQYFLAVAGLALFLVISRAYLRRRPGAGLYLIGGIVLFAAMVNDILNTAEVLRTGYVVPYGFFAFIALQASLLALRFSRAFETSERWSERLEQAIRERTRQLQDSRDELRIARDLAERSSQAKSEFLATMSHEIRTPLNSILGTASLLAESELQAEQSTQVSLLNRAGKRLLTLINEVLDLSRIEAGKLTLDAAPFSIREVCEEVLGIMANRAGRKAVELRSEYAPDLPASCIGDSNRLAQILLNLLGNAIKFTEDGYVLLRVQLIEGSAQTPAPSGAVTLRFSVEDTGIGIAPDKQGQIFESFVQADQRDIRRFEGSGLGLAISRRLVELMHGRLLLRSEPGRGSVFWFDLRLECVSREALAASETSVAQPAQPQIDEQVWPARVLIADDNADNRYLIEIFLKKTGAELRSVENGREALDAFLELSEAAQSSGGDATTGFDLILMDIQMPVMGGYEAVRAIREHEQRQQLTPVRILAITADATREAYHKALDAGCDGYITKPVQKITLLEAVAVSDGG